MSFEREQKLNYCISEILIHIQSIKKTYQLFELFSKQCKVTILIVSNEFWYISK